MKDEDLLDNCQVLSKEVEFPFTKSEYDFALNSIKLRSASGLDQIDFKIIFAFPNCYANIFLYIYNRILMEGVFLQWRQSLVVLICNTGIRPILLISCLLKMMEKVIYFCLRLFVESRNVLPETQFGFRPDRACIDCLVIMFSEIHKGFAENSVTVCAFLDIKSAFDNMISNLLIHELKLIGIPAHVRKFILNLIEIRHMFFVVDGKLIGTKAFRKDRRSARCYSTYILEISRTIFIKTELPVSGRGISP